MSVLVNRTKSGRSTSSCRSPLLRARRLIRLHWKASAAVRCVAEVDTFFESCAERKDCDEGGTSVTDIKVGKPQVKPDTPSHVKGVHEAPGPREKQAGHLPDGTSTAERSTGINPKDENPIAPGMPNSRFVSVRSADDPSLDVAVEALRGAVRRRADGRVRAASRERPAGPLARLARAGADRATRRAYDAAEEDRLLELFGPPSRWGDTLRGFSG